jgi:hypothetical protein
MSRAGQALSLKFSIRQAGTAAERAIHEERQPILGYSGCQEADAMDELIWEKVSAAPYDRDLELAVIEGDHVYALVFACRRTASGWIKIPSMERVTISPTHWRMWSGKR